MKTIEIKWSTEDVLAQAKGLGLALNETQADEILESLQDNHDATIGINWDVIACYIEDYIESKNLFK
jgi:hypothetical protein